MAVGDAPYAPSVRVRLGSEDIYPVSINISLSRPGARWPLALTSSALPSERAIGRTLIRVELEYMGVGALGGGAMTVYADSLSLVEVSCVLVSYEIVGRARDTFRTRAVYEGWLT